MNNSEEHFEKLDPPGKKPKKHHAGHGHAHKATKREKEAKQHLIEDAASADFHADREYLIKKGGAVFHDAEEDAAHPNHHFNLAIGYLVLLVLGLGIIFNIIFLDVNDPVGATCSFTRSNIGVSEVEGCTGAGKVCQPVECRLLGNVSVEGQDEYLCSGVCLPQVPDESDYVVVS